MAGEKIAALAIDGPAGAGKSTTARAAAARLGFAYLDTGAMYRALAWKAARLRVNLEDDAALGELAAATVWHFAAGGEQLWLDGADVSREIRSPEVTAITKFAARSASARRRLAALQREMALAAPAVLEGRDITTVVLPDAKWRVFLTASPETRAARRQRDLTARGFAADYAEILRGLRERDASDFSIGHLRNALNLARAGEIALLDASDLSPDEVVSRLAALVETGG